MTTAKLLILFILAYKYEDQPSCDNRGRDWTDVTTRQGKSRTERDTRSSGTEQIVPEGFKKAWLYRHLDFTLMPPNQDSIFLWS